MTRVLLGIYFAIGVAFLVLPLALVVPISLTDSQFLQFPPQRLSLRWYREFFVDESWVRATLLSLQVGLGATAVALVAGTLAAVAIVRGSFPGRRLLHALLVAPLILPSVIVALGLFILFLRWKWVDSVPALIFAHAVGAIPYVVLIVSASLRSFDTTLERAARVLGAGPLRAFLNVTVPYLGPSLFAASLLAFFASFDELIVTLFVSGGLQTLPVRIWTDLTLRLDPTVAAAASMLIVVSVAGMSIAEYFRQRNVRRYGH
ncbi:MAG: ABC transporter permease [Alphaproteobacteria bacterium]|nr:ABC transporter permease [Alphaproteobacteria bacterium]